MQTSAQCDRLRCNWHSVNFRSVNCTSKIFLLSKLSTTKAQGSEMSVYFLDHKQANNSNVVIFVSRQYTRNETTMCVSISTYVIMLYKKSN